MIDSLVRMINLMIQSHLVNITYLIANIAVFVIVLVTAVLSDITWLNKKVKFAMFEAFVISEMVSQILLLIIIYYILQLIIK